MAVQTITITQNTVLYLRPRSVSPNVVEAIAGLRRIIDCHRGCDFLSQDLFDWSERTVAEITAGDFSESVLAERVRGLWEGVLMCPLDGMPLKDARIASPALVASRAALDDWRAVAGEGFLYGNDLPVHELASEIGNWARELYPERVADDSLLSLTGPEFHERKRAIYAKRAHLAEKAYEERMIIQECMGSAERVRAQTARMRQQAEAMEAARQASAAEHFRWMEGSLQMLRQAQGQSIQLLRNELVGQAATASNLTGEIRVVRTDSANLQQQINSLTNQLESIRRV